MQHGKHRTDGSWFINEFFLKLVFFNIHDTFKAGNWSSHVFLKLVYLQPCQAKVWIDKNGETRTGWITIPQSCQVNVSKGKNGKTCVLLEHQKSSYWLNQQKSQNQIKMGTTNGDPCHSDISEWLQEFRENLLDGVPERRDSHASSSHGSSSEPTPARSAHFG